MCAEVIWAHGSPSSAYFMSYFLSCFQLPHHFQSLPFNPSSPCFSSHPKASLGCPQARKHSSFHTGARRCRWLWWSLPSDVRAELTLVSWVGETNPFPISLLQAQPWAACLMQGSKPRALESHTTPQESYSFFLNITFACTLCKNMFTRCILWIWVDVMICCGFVAFWEEFHVFVRWVTCKESVLQWSICMVISK